MSFGEKLKQIREKKKMTQSQLALKLGVTQRTISYYENNTSKPTNIQLITNIANALDVSIDDLLDIEEDKRTNKIYKLVDKLITDTLAKNLTWEIYDNAVLYAGDYDDPGDVLYSDYFNSSNFPNLKNSDLDFEHSYITKYKYGAYLVLKYTTYLDEEPVINFSLFVFSSNTNRFYYVVNNTALEKIEDLYITITNTDSDIDDFIDEYLKENFEPDSPL